MNDWVDPVDALVGISQTSEKGWFWAVVTVRTHFADEPTTVSGYENTQVDAYLAAVAYIVTTYANVPVNVYSSERKLIDSLNTAGKWPNLEMHPVSYFRTHAAAHHLIRAFGQVVGRDKSLVVSCDGSFSVSRKTGGWAWVNENGNYQQGAGKSISSAHAELMAVDLAVKAHTDGRHSIVVRLDSRDAISLLQNGSRENTPLKIRRLLTQLVAQPAFERCTFEWVGGHTGDPLNEAANRLAIAARRNADANTSVTVAKATALGIVSEHMCAFEQGQLVAATTKVGAVA